LQGRVAVKTGRRLSSGGPTGLPRRSNKFGWRKIKYKS
jgi:hypothetical protein